MNKSHMDYENSKDNKHARNYDYIAYRRYQMIKQDNKINFCQWVKHILYPENIWILHSIIGLTSILITLYCISLFF
jgi:hypothetical protein